MGLSEEERYNNVIEIINTLKQMNTFKDYNLKVFNKPLKNLWFHLLGHTHNSGHWFAGSASTSNNIEGMSIFGSAMIQAKDEFVKVEKDPFKDIIPFEVKEFFDYRDNYIKSAVELLQTGFGLEKSNVFKIFRLTESYFYYANRYDDDLSKMFTSLTKDICNLQGLCYNTFKTDQDYFKAWLLEQIVNKLITYDEKDTVNKLFKHFSMHHNIEIKHTSSKQIFNSFKEIQFKSNFKSEKRLIMLLAMCGTSFHYQHQHKELIKLIFIHNKSFLEDQINIELIEKICKGIFSKKENIEKENIKNCGKNYCMLTENNTYYD